MPRPSHAEIMQLCHVILGGRHGMMPLADMGYNRAIDDAAGWIGLLSTWLAQKDGATVEDAISSLELLIGFLRIIQSDRTSCPDLSPEGKAMRAKWTKSV